jgi:hypothetical protein
VSVGIRARSAKAVVGVLLLAAIVFRVRTQWWLLLVAIVPLFIADFGGTISSCLS